MTEETLAHGVWPVTPAQYHADRRSISRSMYQDFVISPELYWGKWVSRTPIFPIEHKKAEYDIGNAFEDMLQNGGPTKVKLIPDEVLGGGEKVKTKTGDAWRQFQAENIGYLLLKKREYQGVLSMVQSCMRNPKARLLLTELEGRDQVALRWFDEEHGLERKALLDRLNDHKCIVDIKSIVSASDRSINKSVELYGYDNQSIWYQEAVDVCLGENLPFFFVFVQKTPPYSCRVAQLTPEHALVTERTLHTGLARLAECYATNAWQEDKSVYMIPKPAWKD